MRSSPSPDSAFAPGHSPSFMGLRFHEPVAARDVRLRVYGPDGARLDRGPVRVTRSGAVGVHVEPAADGTYAVGWRAVARDGHVTSGSFHFTVGAPTRARAVDAAVLAPGPEATRVSFAAARSLQYAALALAFGTMLFGLVAWRGPAKTVALRRLLLAGLVLGATSAAAALACEAATVAGTTPWSGAIGGVIWNSMTGLSNATCVWALVLAGWLAALALWLRRPGGVAAVVLVDALVVSPAFCGHAAGSALAPAVALHVCAMAAWLGGLVALLAVWRSAPRPLLAGTVDRFSRMALPAACVVLATGALQALDRLGGPAALLNSDYGRLVLAKLVLFSGLLALAARNRLRLAPRLRMAAGGALDASGALRAAVGAEVAIAAVVLAATGVLAGTAPPS